jgi:predicted PurR-regulated permease PerM
LGRRLALNPVVIFVWLIFCGWIWGIVGALLAVPILAVVKIVCDHIEQLAAIGEFLGTESKVAT